MRDHGTSRSSLFPAFLREQRLQLRDLLFQRSDFRSDSAVFFVGFCFPDILLPDLFTEIFFLLAVRPHNTGSRHWPMEISGRTGGAVGTAASHQLCDHRPGQLRIVLQMLQFFLQQHTVAFQTLDHAPYI